MNVAVNMESLLTLTDEGIYCPKADVYIDPWKPVSRALITHAHADHSRWGMKHYMAHEQSVPIIKHRLGEDISISGVQYGQTTVINGVDFTFFPAGHIIGSAQIAVHYKGETWVVSGDYKLESDKTCEPFEPIKCQHFITESTFGLPVFKWTNTSSVIQEVNHWWHTNRSNGITSVLLCYSLGKAQRILSEIDSSIGSIFAHGAIFNMNAVLAQQGLVLPDVNHVTPETAKADLMGSLIIAPPSVQNTTWLKRFKPFQIGITSGWMAIRGTRRRRNPDKAFVLSDHADWTGLNQAIEATGAEHIYVTHGYRHALANWQKELGKNGVVLETAFSGEGEQDS